jgi:hypothetical protein
MVFVFLEVQGNTNITNDELEIHLNNITQSVANKTPGNPRVFHPNAIEKIGKNEHRWYT